MQTLLPVTVLSDFLGVRNSTLLNRVLNNRDGRKVAAILNDISDVNTDADLVQANRQAPSGDCRQKIVFIGSGIDWSQLSARLDNCQVQPAAALGPDNLLEYPDTIPGWRCAENAA